MKMVVLKDGQPVVRVPDTNEVPVLIIEVIVNRSYRFTLIGIIARLINRRQINLNNPPRRYFRNNLPHAHFVLFNCKRAVLGLYLIIISTDCQCQEKMLI